VASARRLPSGFALGEADSAGAAGQVQTSIARARLRDPLPCSGMRAGSVGRLSPVPSGEDAP